jgi:hypothetical protein
MVAPGQILVDLACGRGGYGREVARRAGLDFSAMAVTIAARGGPRSRARFCVGDFTAFGVRDHSAHAVMCIDAIQFSQINLARHLLQAGFEQIEVTDKPDGYAAAHTAGGRPFRPTPAVTRHYSHSAKRPRKRWQPSTSGAACWPQPLPRLTDIANIGSRTPEGRNGACQPFP